MEENKIEKEEKVKNKKHGPLYWVFVVVGVTFIIYTSIGIGEKVVKIKDSDISTKNDSTDKKEDVKEQDGNATNVSLTEEQKKTVATKLATMFGVLDYKYGELIDFTSGWGYEGNIVNFFENKNNIQSQLGYIMSNMTTKKITITNVDSYKFNSNSDVIKDLKNGTEINIISASEVTKLYQYVYGIEPQVSDVIGGCPSYYYEKTTNNYFLIAECGGAGRQGHYIYLDEIQSADEKTINITTYVGAYHIHPEGETYYNDHIRYNNYDITTLTTTHKTITAENKTSFTKYNFVFEKANDGEYYFKNIVKAK